MFSAIFYKEMFGNEVVTCRRKVLTVKMLQGINSSHSQFLFLNFVGYVTDDKMTQVIHSRHL